MIYVLLMKKLKRRDIKQVASGDMASVLNTILYQLHSLPKSGNVIPLLRDMYFKSTNIH